MQTLMLRMAPGGVAIIQFNRPAQRNAFNERMMNELFESLRKLEKDPEVHVLVLTGVGEHFSAGVDIAWYQELVSGEEKDLEEATREHVQLLRLLYEFSRPTIARVQGAALAMSAGLVACCDVVFCSETAYFSFPEIRAGTVPAPAAPYIVQAIGGRRALRYFMSGERISAQKAMQLGLVDECFADEKSLNDALTVFVNELLRGGPQAQGLCKKMVNSITGMQQQLDRLDSYTAATLTSMYAGSEAIDGARAYLSKRPAPWSRERGKH